MSSTDGGKVMGEPSAYDLCAVTDCMAWGEPQVCLWDGKYHHHGRIHYDNGYPSAVRGGLTFRDLDDGGWRGVCKAHMAIMRAAYTLPERGRR